MHVFSEPGLKDHNATADPNPITPTEGGGDGGRWRRSDEADDGRLREDGRKGRVVWFRVRALSCVTLRATLTLAQKDFGGLMDGLMRQLMSKDIMYEPVKAICDKVDGENVLWGQGCCSVVGMHTLN